MEKKDGLEGAKQETGGLLSDKHWLMMIACCLIPVILIIGLQALGITGPWLYGLAIAVCLGGHLLMMKGSKEGKSCH